jgi:hypothetical protein
MRYTQGHTTFEPDIGLRNGKMHWKAAKQAVNVRGLNRLKSCRCDGRSDLPALLPGREFFWSKQGLLTVLLTQRTDAVSEMQW